MSLHFAISYIKSLQFKQLAGGEGEGRETSKVSLCFGNNNAGAAIAVTWPTAMGDRGKLSDRHI